MAGFNDARGRGQLWRPRGWTRLALILVVLAVGGYLSWQKQQREREQPRRDDPAVAEAERRPADESGEPSKGTASKSTEPAAVPEITLPKKPDALPAEESSAAASRSTSQSSPAARKSASATTIANQTIRDLEGEVAYRGAIDVAPTIERIHAGRLLNFPNDGVTFQNRERRLPRKPAGYYKEYVHPTPGLRGPGPQRIVAGENGEFFYTPDHYRTFRRVDQP